MLEKSLNFIFEVLEILNNVSNKETLKTLQQVVIDRHRFHENYADDIQKYTNYIDEVVAGIRNIDMINRQLLLARASARQKYDVYLEKQNVQKHELFLQRKRFLPRDAMLSHYMLSSCVRPSTVCHKSEFYNDG